MTTARVIIKRPDEKIGHIANINTDKENIDKHIGGAGMVHILFDSEDGRVGIIYKMATSDEDEMNMVYGSFPFRKVVKGTAIVCELGANGDLIDLRALTKKQWETLLRKWGNL